MRTYQLQDRSVSVQDGFHQTQFGATSLENARQVALQDARNEALRINRSLQFVISDPTGTWHMEVDPAGSVKAATAEPENTQQTFLSRPGLQEVDVTGWRRLARTCGLNLGPSQTEVDRRDDLRAIAGSWFGPRTVLVLNSKGAAGTTASTAFLSAMFARIGGAGVLSWDRDDSLGASLGWSTEQAAHTSTSLDLLQHILELASATSRAADMSRWTHHQLDDQYDVLRAHPLLLSTDKPLTAEQFLQIHMITQKFYRLTFIDGGKGEGTPTWLAMLSAADSLVIPTTTKIESAESARLLLETLQRRDDHAQELAANAVVILHNAERSSTRELESATERFASLARSVVQVPYDPAIGAQHLRSANLRPRTSRAWIRAAAEVARGFKLEPRATPALPTGYSHDSVTNRLTGGVK